MWFGFAMGYAYHFGLFARIECGSARATSLEKRFPFNKVADKPWFITAGGAAGGEIVAAGGAFGGGSTSREAPADEESKAGSSSSMSANFKAFAGKGTSIGGDPVAAAPRFDSQGASASRGRSTPETRAASSAAAGSAGRQGSALIAKLEEKKKMEAAGDSSALTTTDVGVDMEPDIEEPLYQGPGDDKNGAAYGAVNETDDSV